MVERTCFDCQFYAPARGSTSESGDCRFNPPTTSTIDGDGDWLEARWPKVHEDEWCGQHSDARGQSGIVRRGGGHIMDGALPSISPLEIMIKGPGYGD